jgi:hypothetical protein
MEAFELWGRPGGRGEAAIIKPIGRRLAYRPIHGGEWIVEMVARNPFEDLHDDDQWRHLYVKREEANGLVIEVKRRLGLVAPAILPPAKTHEADDEVIQRPQEDDDVAPAIRALADKMFDRYMQLDVARSDFEYWHRQARDELQASHKSMIQKAYRCLFKTERHRPPVMGWPLAEHYQRKREEILAKA